MVLTLVLVCAGAAMALAYVNELTREPIAKARLRAKVAAIEKVLPAFENNPYEDRLTINMPKQGDVEIYPARDADGKMVGLAVPASDPGGYGGKVELLFGFNTTGDVTGFEKLKMEETPGLGDGILKEKFKKQFFGINADTMKLTVKKDGGDVDAVTAATISSRAATSALVSAFDIYNMAVITTDLKLQPSGKPRNITFSLPDALKHVLPEHANSPIEEPVALEQAGFEQVLYPARNAEGEIIAVAIVGYIEKGYKDSIRFLVGFDLNGKIIKIATLEEKETPGLGASVATPKFLGQFSGFTAGNPELVTKKDGGNVDAITGATVTTKAALKAIETAFNGFEQAKKQNIFP